MGGIWSLPNAGPGDPWVAFLLAAYQRGQPQRRQACTHEISLLTWGMCCQYILRTRDFLSSGRVFGSICTLRSHCSLKASWASPLPSTSSPGKAAPTPIVNDCPNRRGRESRLDRREGTTKQRPKSWQKKVLPIFSIFLSQGWGRGGLVNRLWYPLKSEIYVSSYWAIMFPNSKIRNFHVSEILKFHDSLTPIWYSFIKLSIHIAMVLRFSDVMDQTQGDSLIPRL